MSRTLRLSLALMLVAAGAAAAVAVAATAAKRAAAPRMTTPAMLEKARERLDATEKALAESFQQLEAARKAADIQRLDCVNEALTAVKGLVRLAQQNYTAMQELAAQGDTGRVEHEFVKLSLAADKVATLSVELKACGAPSISSEVEGEPERTLLSDDDLPLSEGDPLSWFSDTDVILREPAVSSPAF